MILSDPLQPEQFCDSHPDFHSNPHNNKQGGDRQEGVEVLIIYQLLFLSEGGERMQATPKKKFVHQRSQDPSLCEQKKKKWI